MQFGAGDYTYTYADGWLKTPPGWTWGWIPAVACDSRDRVFVYSRSQHPLAVFDRDGNFTGWTDRGELGMSTGAGPLSAGRSLEGSGDLGSIAGPRTQTTSNLGIGH